MERHEGLSASEPRSPRDEAESTLARWPRCRRCLWLVANLGLCGGVAWVCGVVDRMDAPPELATDAVAGAVLGLGLVSLTASLKLCPLRRLALIAVGLGMLTVVIRESLGYREFVRTGSTFANPVVATGNGVNVSESERRRELADDLSAAGELPQNMLDYIWRSLDDGQPFSHSRRLWRLTGAATLLFCAGVGAWFGQAFSAVRDAHGR